MVIFGADFGIKPINRRNRPLQQLQIDIGAANQRPGDVIAGIIELGAQQDMAQRRLVKPEGARRIDQLYQ